MDAIELRDACCALRAAFCVLHAASRALRVACCVLHAANATRLDEAVTEKNSTDSLNH